MTQAATGPGDRQPWKGQCSRARRWGQNSLLTGGVFRDLAWIAAVRADADGLPGLGSYAAGLEHDLDAVTRGLTTHWSSAPIEGRVNHIKMVKRQMFGRAGLPLLRKRVLLTAARL